MGEGFEPTEGRDEPAAGEGLADAYARLRSIAGRLMKGERQGHTLSPTDLVHEALARLLDGDAGVEAIPSSGPDFVKFVGFAARAMTQVLVDHARRRGAVKRGRGFRRIDLDDIDAAIAEPSSDWSTLHEALEELQRRDPRRHAVVTLRVFAGMDNRQIARQLALDERTVGRDWLAARLWLQKALGE